MSGDSGQLLPNPPRADFTMPRVVHMDIRRTTFEPPRLRNFESSLKRSQDAVEFIVVTESPIPIRNLGPVLYVGDEIVTEMTPVGPNTYRFIEPQRESLREGAPISLNWAGQGPRTDEQTRFLYHLDSIS